MLFQLVVGALLGLLVGWLGRELLLRDRAHPVQLAVAADGGKRSAQLVPGVGHEAPHPVLRGGPGGEGLFDLREHRVE